MVFRRFTFRLTEDSVSLALHSVLGGTPAGFRVTYLKDCHYRFPIASKQLGLTICALKRIISGHFDVYFHLCRNGGGGGIGSKNGENDKRKKISHGRWFLAASFSADLHIVEYLIHKSSSRILQLRNSALT
jgi:hypothetical protein